MIQPANLTPPVVIYGAGAHGHVVADAATAAGLTVLGFIDDNAQSAAGRLLNHDDPRLDTAAFIPAVGDNAARHAIFHRLDQQGRTLTNIIHPHATVSPSATLGRGVYVGPQAVVGPYAQLADACLINSAAVVEHHGELGVAVHVAPTAALAGRVTVGEQTLVGLGAKVLPGVTLGQDCTVGAGAVVTRDVTDQTTVFGVPAKPQ